MPAAFLAAVTVAVLLVRGTLGDDAPSVAAPVRPAAQRPSPPRRTTAATPAVQGAFHELRAGDTLGTVADRYDTSVEALVELNPGIDPVALQVGRRVRVK